MKIRTNELRKILSKLNVNDNVLLNFTDNCLEVRVKNESSTLLVLGSFKPSCFEEYEGLGEVPIQNLSNIIKLLGTLGESVSVKIQGNIISFISGNRKVETELANKEVVKPLENKPLPKFEGVSTVNMKSVDLKTFIDNVSSINRDYEIVLSTSDDKFIISNQGRYKYSDKYDSPGNPENKSKYGEPLLEGVRSLTDDVTIEFKTDHPAIIIEETNGSVVKVLVAPRVESN